MSEKLLQLNTMEKVNIVRDWNQFVLDINNITIDVYADMVSWANSIFDNRFSLSGNSIWIEDDTDCFNFLMKYSTNGVYYGRKNKQHHR